jgi:choline dehydrogenase-like flavoprotein
MTTQIKKVKELTELWICEGSVFRTGGAVNPSLTIEATATRTARLALERT